MTEFEESRGSNREEPVPDQGNAAAYDLSRSGPRVPRGLSDKPHPEVEEPKTVEEQFNEFVIRDQAQLPEDAQAELAIFKEDLRRALGVTGDDPSPLEIDGLVTPAKEVSSSQSRGTSIGRDRNPISWTKVLGVLNGKQVSLIPDLRTLNQELMSQTSDDREEQLERKEPEVFESGEVPILHQMVLRDGNYLHRVEVQLEPHTLREALENLEKSYGQFEHVYSSLRELFESHVAPDSLAQRLTSHFMEQYEEEDVALDTARSTFHHLHAYGFPEVEEVRLLPPHVVLHDGEGGRYISQPEKGVFLVSADIRYPDEALDGRNGEYSRVFFEVSLGHLGRAQFREVYSEPLSLDQLPWAGLSLEAESEQFEGMFSRGEGYIIRDEVSSSSAIVDQILEKALPEKLLEDTIARYRDNGSPDPEYSAREFLKKQEDPRIIAGKVVDFDEEDTEGSPQLQVVVAAILPNTDPFLSEPDDRVVNEITYTITTSDDSEIVIAEADSRDAGSPAFYEGLS